MCAEHPEYLNDAQPMLTAARTGRTEVVALEMTGLLLELGADPTFKGADGRTAEAAARGRGLLDAADLMQEAAGEAPR